MVEALDMAIYAKYRAGDQIYKRLDNPLQNLLGAPNEDDPTSLNLVESQSIHIFSHPPSIL